MIKKPKFIKKMVIAWADRALAAGLDKAFIESSRLFRGSYGAAVLLYHRVLPKEEKEIFSSPHIVVSTTNFEKQLDFIANHYQVTSLEELAALLAGGKLPSPRLVAVTFDDGWEDNYLHAYPILKKYGVPATIFPSVGFMGGGRIFNQEKLRFLLSNFKNSMEIEENSKTLIEAGRLIKKTGWNNSEHIINYFKHMDADAQNTVLEELDDYLLRPTFPLNSHSFLSWDQIKEMADNGISFGSHTINHQILTRASEKDNRLELTASKRMLEDVLEKPVNMFAYPNGDYDHRAMALVRDCGYDLALTTVKGQVRPGDSMFALKRINVGGGRFSDQDGKFSDSLLRATLSGLF